MDRTGEFEAPETATLVDWPVKDLPTVKAEAQTLDESIQENDAQLPALAVPSRGFGPIQAISGRRCLFVHCTTQWYPCVKPLALQGWVPKAKAETLADELKGMGIQAAVDIIEPEEDEEPPTLIEYPKWVTPIKALFDTLGTLPAYNEMDLSAFFMVGLPLFSAMLIGDAGYGLILAGAGFAFYNKLVKASGKPTAQLLIVFGVATFIWGALTGNYFGVTPSTLTNAGYQGAANILAKTAPLFRFDDQGCTDLIMQISLILGCIHLIIAHLKRLIAIWPDVRAFAEVGWIVHPRRHDGHDLVSHVYWCGKDLPCYWHYIAGGSGLCQLVWRTTQQSH